MDNAKFKKFLEKELEKIADIVDDIYDKLEEVDDMEVFDSADVWLSGIKQLISYDDGDLVVDSTAADTILTLQ
jgi:predicted transglutaminase-like cysteine proteinase